MRAAPQHVREFRHQRPARNSSNARQPEIGPEQALRGLTQHNIINNPSVMVRMDVTRQILPFYVSYWKWAPDWQLWILLAAAGFNFLWDPAILHKYRVHAASLSQAPSRMALRKIERYLAPFHALKTASGFSAIAFRVWREFRKPLYHTWLVKAASLAVKNELRAEDFEMGMNAYYGGIPHRTNVWLELLRHGIAPWMTYRREATDAQKPALPGFRVGLRE